MYVTKNGTLLAVGNDADMLARFPRETILVPWADFFNHDSEASTHGLLLSVLEDRESLRILVLGNHKSRGPHIFLSLCIFHR